VKAPQRGEVWLVDLGMAAKVRPAAVMSIPAADVDRALVTIVPHTTSARGSRFEAAVSVNGEMRVRQRTASSTTHSPHRRARPTPARTPTRRPTVGARLARTAACSRKDRTSETASCAWVSQSCSSRSTVRRSSFSASALTCWCSRPRSAEISTSWPCSCSAACRCSRNTSMALGIASA